MLVIFLSLQINQNISYGCRHLYLINNGRLQIYDPLHSALPSSTFQFFFLLPKNAKKFTAIRAICSQWMSCLM